MQLENQAVPGRRRHDPIALAALIRWCIETFETTSKWQRSKQSHLEFLERHAVGKVNALELTAAALIGHVRRRRADGAGPATAMNDLIWIGVALQAASNVRELPVRPEVAQEARATLRLIGKARKRARRPTPQELARLRDYFAARDRRADIPMLAIMNFAIASARRGAKRRSPAWNGRTTTILVGPGWCGMRSIRGTRKATTAASSTPPRPGPLLRILFSVRRNEFARTGSCSYNN